MQEAVQKLKRQNKRIGFIPTMGYLHEGHLSLLRKSRKENDVTILSIFVNPTQFGPGEDFRKYPRDIKKDELLAKKEKIDIIFYPSVEEMYPTGFLTYVDVKKTADVLCGRFRPGHFRGVATIVAKLLNVVCPDVLYFGAKDAQQAVIIKQMVRNLNFSVKVKTLPIVREHDGLAMSSRNKYLTPPERAEATVLFQSLQAAKKKIRTGTKSATIIQSTIKNMVRKKPSCKVQYIECVNAETLQPLSKLKGNILIALAVHVGKTRLIDNITVHVK